MIKIRKILSFIHCLPLLTSKTLGSPQNLKPYEARPANNEQKLKFCYF